MEKRKLIMLPFGKRVMCGNYYVLKTMRTLPGKEVKRLREKSNVPEGMRKYLQRSSLPCITVGTVSCSWTVTFMGGMNMFDAINSVPVFQDDKGHCSYMGPQALNLASIINFWACATSTVGDDEFQADVIKAMQRYLDRMSKKNSDPLPEEETKKICDEEINREKNKATLIDMSKMIKENNGTKNQ